MRTVLFVFADPSAAAPWEAVHDTVMGGRSTGVLEGGAGAALFAGNLSLAGGGGFASVRVALPPGVLRGAGALAFRVRGDGRRYHAFVKTADGPDAGIYKAPLDLPAGSWHEVRLPFTGFAASLHGKPIPGAPPLDPAAVRSLGVILADGREGEFRLEIAAISADSA